MSKICYEIINIFFIGIDQRGGLSYASCGDKSYQAPEYSANFHELGSTLPLFSFG